MTPKDRIGVAVVLAGGRGRRLGGADKPGLVLGGKSLLDRVLAAVEEADVVVVGPPRQLPPGVRQVREDPAGSGPAAALVAGIRLLEPAPGALVAVLAADQPGITREVMNALVHALARTREPTVPANGEPFPSGAVAGARAAGPDGRGQPLLSVWHTGALIAAVAARPSWAGASIGELLGSLPAVDVPVRPEVVRDVDTPMDLDRWRRDLGDG